MTKKFWKDNHVDAIAYILISLFIIAFTLLSFGRHDSLKSYLNDLGAYDQVIWNLAHGNFFEMSSSMLNEKNFLGGHFSLIVLSFLPFYLISASPKWLLFFQSFSVGISALPVFWLAREKLKSAIVPLIFLVSYLFYPILHNGLIYDFHEVVFAVAFASFAFYFLEKNRDRWFIFFSILLAISQEHLVLLVFMMGIYAIIAKKRYKFGIFVCAASLLYFILVLMVFMPFFSSTKTPALLSSNNSQYPPRYAWLGKNLIEIVKNILLHPFSVLEVLFSAERVRYLFMLVIPVSSLSIFAFPIIIILPLLAINLLSSNSMTFDISYYHSAIFAPFIFFSALYAYKKWFWDSKYLRYLFAFFVLACSIGSSLFWSLTPLSGNYKLSDFVPSPHAKSISEIKKILPEDASLSVQHNLGPHFSERRFVYRFPIQKDEAQYVLLDAIDPYAENPKQHFLFPYALQMDSGEWLSDIDELKKSEKYSLIFDDDGFLLFKSIKK